LLFKLTGPEGINGTLHRPGGPWKDPHFSPLEQGRGLLSDVPREDAIRFFGGYEVRGNRLAGYSMHGGGIFL
jgi:hypothetical protein